MVIRGRGQRAGRDRTGPDPTGGMRTGPDLHEQDRASLWAENGDEEAVVMRSGRRAMVRGLGAVAGIAGLVAARSVIPAGTPRIRPERAGDTPIAELERVRIGGADQWVLQRSRDVGNPIVLYLHGGPGTSHLTANRRITGDLEREFLVVTWDQRGAGKSYRAIDDVDRMNIEQFVEDTRELSSHLLARFGQDRLVLVGHSWGSVIGAMAAARYPEIFSCYVGIGQVARMREGELLSYRWTLAQARERGDARAVEALEQMGEPPYSGDWREKTVRQRGLLARYGGEIHGSSRGAFEPVLTALAVSREYTLADRVNYFRGIFGSMKLLWPQLMEVDLFESVPEIPVPVFLVEGRHDMEAPASVAERYFEALRAPSKELIWFERSAHLPNTEERDRFTRFMIDRVHPLAVAGATAV